MSGEVILIWLKFLICFLVILVAGTRLSKYGDVIAEKTGLGRAWVGVVLLAAATSFPELITGVSSVALVGEPDLTLGDLFGSNIFNLVIIALVDILYRRGPALSEASLGIVLTAAMAALVIAFAAISIYVAQNVSTLGLFGYIGLYSPLIFVLYLVAQWMIFRFERRQQAQLAPNVVAALEYKHISTKRAFISYGIAALVVIAAGTWLAFIGKEISEITGLGYSFVGTLFIAAATSMPEMVVSVAAIRLGSVDMAVGNMVGSNLFNMGVVIFADDLFFGRGPLLSHVSQDHIFTAFVAILMTCVVMGGLIYRPRKKSPLGVSWDAIALIVLYLVGFYTLYSMGRT